MAEIINMNSIDKSNFGIFVANYIHLANYICKGVPIIFVFVKISKRSYGIIHCRSRATQRRNDGIWAPDSGSCDTPELIKLCKLPLASKFYAWSQRDKEIPIC